MIRLSLMVTLDEVILIPAVSQTPSPAFCPFIIENP